MSMTLRLKQIGHLRNVSLVHFSECIQLSELLAKKRFVAYIVFKFHCTDTSAGSLCPPHLCSLCIFVNFYYLIEVSQVIIHDP